MALITTGLSAVAMAMVAPNPSLVDVGQIPAESARTETGAIMLIQPRLPDSEQLTNAADKALVAPPAGAREEARRTSQQVSDGKRSAESGPSLSRREQSRPGAKEVLTGSDRCDPGARTKDRSAACARVIEARSGEFERAPPTLSPEQRLLLEQRALPADGYQGSAKRLANNPSADLSLEDQAVASVALSRTPPAVPRKEEEQKAPISPEQAAVIVGAITSQPPR